jgi:TolA protein
MRVPLVISICLHACAILMLMYLFHSSPRARLPEKVYSIRLMSARGGSRAAKSAGPPKSVTKLEMTKARAKAELRRKPEAPAPKVAVPKKTAKDKSEALAKAKADAKAKAEAKAREEALAREQEAKSKELAGNGEGQGEGSGAGPGTEDGTGISVDAAQFPFAYFLSAIERKVSDHWFSTTSQPGAGLTCVVYFRLKRDGSIEDVRGERSSGNEFFDRSAVRAVKSASPFPPLPRGFQDEFLGIHFTFVQKD